MRLKQPERKHQILLLLCYARCLEQVPWRCNGRSFTRRRRGAFFDIVVVEMLRTVANVESSPGIFERVIMAKDVEIFRRRRWSSFHTFLPLQAFGIGVLVAEQPLAFMPRVPVEGEPAHDGGHAVGHVHWRVVSAAFYRLT